MATQETVIYVFDKQIYCFEARSVIIYVSSPKIKLSKDIFRFFFFFELRIKHISKSIINPTAIMAQTVVNTYRVLSQSEKSRYMKYSPSASKTIGSIKTSQIFCHTISFFSFSRKTFFKEFISFLFTDIGL